MSDHTDDVEVAEGLEGPSSTGHRTSAANAATAMAIEDARAVAGSLLGPWKRDRRDLWDLQRPWPSLDPSLPRGLLRHPSAPIPEPPAPENPGNNAPRKRQRREADASAEDDQAVAAVKPDGSLELPTVPGVSPEVVSKALEDRQRCGVCAGCKAAPRSSRKTAPCDVLKATKQWKEALGGVTYAAVREVASKIDVPRADVTYKGRVGYGVHCGLCPACTSNGTKACVVPAAIVADTLPLRLKAAAAEGIAARTRERPEDARISLKDYLAQMPGHSRPEIDSAGEAVAVRHGNGGANGESDDEDVLRWAAWGAYLSNTSGPAAQGGDRARLEQQAPGRQHRSNTAHPTAPEAAQRAGFDPESLTEWVCRAQVPSAELPTPQRMTRQQSAAGTSLPTLEDCGHLNSRGAFSCESCGMPRWDGPLGQLRARVAAALHGGLLAGAAGLPVAEADAALAAAVAARMAAEAGNAPNALPGFLEAEEQGAAGASAGGDDSSPEGTLQEIYAEVQAVRKALEAAAAANRPGREASGRSSSAMATTAAAARATQLAGAVVELESAVLGMVEEQEGLAAVKRRRMDALQADEKEGLDPAAAAAAAAAEAEPTTLRALRSLQALLAEDQVHAASRPGSAAESEDGGGNGGASGTVSFSTFCARVSAYLSGVADEPQNFPLGRHRATCELLFCCPPPLPVAVAVPGWTEASLAQLEAVLCDVQSMEVLKVASYAGGTPMVRRALHALLRLAEHSAVAAAVVGDGDGFFASGGSQMQASQQLLLLPTQQSQPEPALPAPGGEAPPEAAAAPPPPADADVAQFLTIVDDLIAAYEVRELQPSEPSSVDASSNDAASPRLRRLAHASAATLSFLYGLTHAVLDTVSLSQAEKLMPVHLASAKATVLEHARFPGFPPLPLPSTSFMEPSGSVGRAGDSMYRPVPDSRRPAQAMAPGIAQPTGRGGRRPLPPRSELGPRPGGAFAAWDGRMEDRKVAPRQQHGYRDGLVAAEAAVSLCPADAQLVFTEALKGGMRPEAVEAAARRYVALTAAAEEEG